jgi:pantothenate kinase
MTPNSQTASERQNPSIRQRGPAMDRNHIRTSSIASLAEHARHLVETGRRRVLGIVGPPGAGKSTIASAMCDALAPDAAVVPLDGFHLDNSVLDDLGLRDRKGAPETFDVAGFVALLRRLRSADEELVYAPLFRREIDTAVAGAAPLRREIPLIVVEGNYLLHDAGRWQEVRGLLDEVWYLKIAEDTRKGRLVRRHESFGRSTDEATRWVERVDDLNAQLVASTCQRADVIVAVDGLSV